jgi:chromodomain-helicase-DNA-binding protein 1
MRRDFLAELWPVDDTSKSVTGQRLSKMYQALRARKSNPGDSSSKPNGR